MTTALPCHTPPPSSRAKRRALLIALVITSTILVAEAIGGWLTGSLALLADAGHMLTDAGALALSLVAIWFAARPASASRTYGHRRIEILAALANGVSLILISFYIFYEAYERFSDPPDIRSGPMLVVASIGLVANLVSAWVLHRGAGGHAHEHGEGHAHGPDHGPGHGEDLNLRGAFLHVLGDLLGSVGAIAAGLLIHFWGLTIADPIISVLIAFILLFGSIRLVLRSVDVLLEAAPPHLDVEAIREALVTVEGIASVHDLHVWTITSGMPVLTVHATVEDSADRDRILELSITCCRDRFGIAHSTIQLEGGDRLC